MTLRDTDEDRLMARMEQMMARYPMEAASEAPADPEVGWGVAPWAEGARGGMEDTTYG